jgi:cytochrome c oxidase subunit IV
MERDDIIEYSLDAHHSEEAGVKIRKKIIFVTLLLTAITAVEVICGMFIKQTSDYWTATKWFFIVLTLVKAGYIVLVFMHLGEERKGLKYVILIPYFIFMFYFIFIMLTEGTAVGETLNIYGS